MVHRRTPGGARPTGLIVVALLGATAALGGCQAPAEGEAPQTTGSNPSQSIPSSMLNEGGTQALPPAQEFSLDELGFDFGSEDAPIKIVEFSDFGCGFCRRFHTETFPTLMEEFVESGMVQWKYVTYVSGMFPNGLPAAFTAECVGEQGLFMPIMQVLYEQQAVWKPSKDPFPTFETFVTEVGADLETFRACILEERQRGRVRSGILSGSRLGVRGTPSFLVDGYPLVGAQPYDVWKEIITRRMADIQNPAAS